jgi:hypothetical protein
MIKIAEELIEAVSRRKKFVAVTQMVLAELAGYIAERFQKIRYRRVFRPQAEIRSGKILPRLDLFFCY